jgi:hypothetical protein
MSFIAHGHIDVPSQNFPEFDFQMDIGYNIGDHNAQSRVPPQATGIR